VKQNLILDTLKKEIKLKLIFLKSGKNDFFLKNFQRNLSFCAHCEQICLLFVSARGSDLFTLCASHFVCLFVWMHWAADFTKEPKASKKFSALTLYLSSLWSLVALALFKVIQTYAPQRSTALQSQVFFKLKKNKWYMACIWKKGIDFFHIRSLFLSASWLSLKERKV